MLASGTKAARLAGLVGLIGSFLIAGAIRAQSVNRLTGLVLDSLVGVPVAGADVTIEGSSYSTQTNESGVFVLPHVPVGEYAVTVHAAGYAAAVLRGVAVEEDISSNVVFRLSPILHFMDAIRVIGKTPPASWENATVIDRSQIKSSASKNLAELLQSVEGVHITRSAGRGPALVSIRGSSPEHVLVLVDGHRANPMGSGTFDLNTIPISIVERIEVYRGGMSSRYGPDALAGVVNIITQPNGTREAATVTTVSEAGNWRTRRVEAGATDFVPLKTLNTRVSIMSSRSDGDFNYNYSVQPQNQVYSGTRLNNGSESSNYFLSGRFDPNASATIAMSSQWYESTGGLPGQASQPTPDARSSDKRQMLNATWVQELSRNFWLESRAGLSRYGQHFEDLKNPSPLFRFNSEYTNDMYSIESGIGLELNQTRVLTGLQMNYDALDQVDFMRPTFSMGHTTRSAIGVYTMASRSVNVSRMWVVDVLSVDAALRYDRARSEKDSTSSLDITKSHDISEWSPKIGFAVKRGGAISGTLRGNYGKSFRLPSINALFWQGDAYSRGNPGLRPERSEHSEISVEATWSHSPIAIRIGITYFHRYISDLIVWAQGQGGAWQPYNLAAARISGHEDAITVSILRQLLSFQYTNTNLTSRNRVVGHVTYDKELTFTPHYIQNLSLKLSHKFVFGACSIRSVGKRYALPNNQKFFDAYTVVDANIGGRLSLGRLWRLSVEYDVNNLDEENYVLIAHYPMPDREWTVGLKIEFGRTQ